MRISGLRLDQTLFLFCVFYQWTHAVDYMTGVESFLETQKYVVDYLSDYIFKEEKRMTVLNEILKRFKKEKETIEDAAIYHTNYFMLLIHLSSELQLMHRNINIVTEYIKNETLKFPSDEDLEGAVEALVRLQNIYQLNVSELAGGICDDRKSTPMSYEDCLVIGKSRYDQRDFENGLKWMLEALSKALAEDHTQSEIHKGDRLSVVIDIVQIIANSFIAQDMQKRALEWNNCVTTLQSKERNPKELLSVLQKYKERLFYKEIQQDRIAPKFAFKRTIGDRKERLMHKTSEYESLCRNDVNLPNDITWSLKCRYLSDGHPFLWLARVKVEELYFRPDIIMYHDVMSDSEIDHIKAMARAKLKNTNTVKTKISESRTCRAVRLSDSRCDVIRRVSRRVSHCTGLGVDTAKDLQVSDYGIGGHFLPHYDFSKNSSFFKHGNIVATVLFYMSEVSAGGATVFPELGLTVFPVKGAALFWYNLHPSGEKNLATYHGACPVLRGYKWVATKWLHEIGQEFNRPCGLVDDQDDYLRLRIIKPKSRRLLIDLDDDLDLHS